MAKLGPKRGISTAKRRLVILQMLDEKNEVNITDLSKMFSISEVSIRNDLGNLENQNLLVRVRGGAMKNGVINREIKLKEKISKNSKEKKAIAKVAANLIQEGDSILIDSGSTTEEFARLLTQRKNLTVVTNALNIVQIFIDSPNISVVMPGGMLRHSSHSLVGMNQTQNLNNYYCDKLILGADAINVNEGIFTPNIEEANLNIEMIRISKEVILLADSSKFERKSLSKIADIQAIHTIITDSGLSAAQRQVLQSKGVKLIIAED
jgi:DeoR family transcriptional regulator of aga operon